MLNIQHRLYTSFDGLSHVTLLAGGELVELSENVDVRLGPAVLWVQAWVENADNAADLVCSLSNDLGFRMDGLIESISTRPKQDSKGIPAVYNVRLLPCRRD